HGAAQFVVAEKPNKAFHQSLTRAWHAMRNRMMQDCWCHTVLMHRINFIEVDDLPSARRKKPRPFSPRTLQCDQPGDASICRRDSKRIVHHLAIVEESETAIDLSGERREIPSESSAGIEEQSARRAKRGEDDITQ